MNHSELHSVMVSDLQLMPAGPYLDNHGVRKFITMGGEVELAQRTHLLGSFAVIQLCILGSACTPLPIDAPHFPLPWWIQGGVCMG